MICHVFLHTLGGSFLAMHQDEAQKKTLHATGGF